VPDPDDPRAPIRFGTSGWRGILGEDFTFPRLRAAVRGVAAWFAEAGGGEVVVAHDTRFLADRMAELAARILAESGARPTLSRGALPTPAAVRAVRRRGAAGAVVLTASHNPPEYQGLKVFGARAGGIDDAAARRIEQAIACAESGPPQPAPAPRPVDLRRAYVGELVRRIDAECVARARPRVVFDAMHGTGAGVLDAVLERCGARLQVLRSEADPRFGGAAPDPAARRLGGLAAQVRGLRGLRLGVATDGDADRFAAVDADGRVFSETEGLALLVDHLAHCGRLRRGVALSIATGSLVERVARSHGLAVSRHPIGFKHFGPVLLSGEADVAGEESGGFALGAFSADKDGILAACLLTELVASSRRPLGARLARLVARHGRSQCGRMALPADARARDALEALRRAPPGRVDGGRVRTLRDDDGLRLGLDDGFLMLRASGTEPVLRVYAEAPGPRRLRRRLAWGAALLGSSGVPRRSR
jgi:phosphomannomutase